MKEDENKRWRTTGLRKRDEDFEREWQSRHLFAKKRWVSAISDILVEVKPDAIAQKLVESDLHKMSSLHFDDNDTDLEISRNRDKIRIQLSERELKRVKVQQFTEMYQAYGDMAPVVDA